MTSLRQNKTKFAIFCIVVIFYLMFAVFRMNRPRRYTAQQAIRLLQQIDENFSGDSGDAHSDAAESDIENCYLRASTNRTSSSDNESGNGDHDGEPLVSVVTNQPMGRWTRPRTRS